jgi:GNAT superfamily N-acetyltransferase
MPGFTIRKAAQADADELYEMRLLLQRHGEEANPTIWRLTKKGEEKTRRDTEEMLKDENGIVLIAERDGAPVGFAYGRHIYREEYEPPNIGQVMLIFVKEPHRTRGAGSLLVAGLCRFFDSKGVEDVTLNYIHGNTDAEGFWGSLGLKHRLHIAGIPLGDLKRRLRVP